MSHIPKPSNKNDTKPIYIVTILDDEDNIVYVKTRQDFFNIYPSNIDVRGIVITKTNANKLSKAKEIDRSLGEKEKQVHLMVPLSRWVKTENISFNGLA